jgi:hypothetical protein
MRSASRAPFWARPSIATPLAIARRSLQVKGKEHPIDVVVVGVRAALRWAFQEIVDPWDVEHVMRAKFLEPADARA